MIFIILLLIYFNVSNSILWNHRFNYMISIKNNFIKFKNKNLNKLYLIKNNIFFNINNKKKNIDNYVYNNIDDDEEKLRLFYFIFLNTL